MKKIYRISDKSNPFPLEFNYITREICLKNFVDVFGLDDLIIIADNCTEDTINFVKSLQINDIRCTQLGNSGTLKYAFEICYAEFKDDDIVYFSDDDFLYLPEPEKYITEGLSIAEYVSLYDHLDKYLDNNQNPFIRNGGEITRVVKTASTHWKYPNSIGLVCATTVAELKRDKEILYRYNFRGSVTDSFATTLELIRIGRRIATPLPGRATACDKFPSPFVDWKKVAQKYE